MAFWQLENVAGKSKAGLALMVMRIWRYGQRNLACTLDSFASRGRPAFALLL